jgi:hypothetical protein
MSAALPNWVRSDRDYDAISKELLSQLEAVPPATDGMMEYRPCKVTLADGRVCDTVYVVPKDSYIRVWGVWPEEDSGKRSVLISEVRRIEESPKRLPPKWANYIYQGGESAMGGTFFAVRFADGSAQIYDGGNAIDFVELPKDRRYEDIVGIDRHTRTGNPRSRVLPYTWCLYDGIKE